MESQDVWCSGRARFGQSGVFFFLSARNDWTDKKKQGGGMPGGKATTLAQHGKAEKSTLLGFGACGRGRYNIGKTSPHTLIPLGSGGVLVCC